MASRQAPTPRSPVSTRLPPLRDPHLGSPVGFLKMERQITTSCSSQVSPKRVPSTGCPLLEDGSLLCPTWVFQVRSSCQFLVSSTGNAGIFEPRQIGRSPLNGIHEAQVLCLEEDSIAKGRPGRRRWREGSNDVISCALGHPPLSSFFDDMSVPFAECRVG